MCLSAQNDKFLILERTVTRYLCRHNETHSAYYFIRHIFYYLRTHPELLEETDYKRLYEEVLEFLIWRSDKNFDASAEMYEDRRNNVIIILDLNIKYDWDHAKNSSRQDVDWYLGLYRCIWAASE